MRKLLLLLLLLVISTASAQKTVHVRQYTRKDGTVVAAHERRTPSTTIPKAASSTSALSTAHTSATNRTAAGKKIELGSPTFPKGAPAPGTPPQQTTRKTVHVRQYTRKDGTVVAAHERSAPGTAAPTQRPTSPSTVQSPSRTGIATSKTPAATHVNPTLPKGPAASRVIPIQQGIQKTVHVRQYTRKDGTVVAAHDRRAPGTAAPEAAHPSQTIPNATATAWAADATPPIGPTPRTTTSGQPIYVGPRGGEYHYSASGRKVYTKKKE